MATSLTFSAVIVLWVYTALLLVGGLIGFFKAGSKVSLISSVVFGIPLALCAAKIIDNYIVADALLTVLLVVFAIRFGKTKKFMPSGMMMIVTIIADAAVMFFH